MKKIALLITTLAFAGLTPPATAAQPSIEDLNGLTCSGIGPQDDFSFLLTSKPSQGSNTVQVVRALESGHFEVASKFAGHGVLKILGPGRGALHAQLNFSGEVLEVRCQSDL